MLENHDLTSGVYHILSMFITHDHVICFSFKKHNIWLCGWGRSSVAVHNALREYYILLHCCCMLIWVVMDSCAVKLNIIRALYRIVIYRLYQYLGYMIHILSFILVNLNACKLDKHIYYIYWRQQTWNGLSP